MGWILSRFGVEESEQRLVRAMLAYAFLLGMSQLYVAAPAYSLFLRTYSASLLPYVYVLVALLATLTSIGYMRLSRYLSFQHVLLSNLVLLFGMTFLLRCGLEFPGRRWLTFVLPIWHEVFWVLASLALWSLAGRLFDVRQGKRLFGLLIAGRQGAEILCGVLTPVVVMFLGTANLLWVSVAASALAIYVLLRISSSFGHLLQASEIPQASTTTTPQPRLSTLLRQRYILLFFIQAILGYLAYYFIDNIFYDRAKLQFPNTDQLSGFIGVFTGVASGLSLLGSLLLTSKVIKRFGVAIAIVALPASVFLAVVAFSVTGFLRMQVLLIFAMAVLIKLLYVVFANVTDIPATHLLYQPLPAVDRVQVQTISEGMVGPSASGLAGLLLLLFSVVFGLDVIGFGYILIPIMLAWCLTSAGLGRLYPHQIKKMLTRKILSESAPEDLDEQACQVLLEHLEHAQLPLARFCLNNLEQAEYPELDTRLLLLLKHPMPPLRQEALVRLARRRPLGAWQPVLEAMQEEADAEVKGAALHTLAALDPAQSVEILMPLLQDSEDDVRVGAMAGLLRFGEEEGIAKASPLLKRMVSDARPAERTLAARLIGVVGDERFASLLETLLLDPDEGTRHRALHAARTLRAASLLPALIQNLDASQNRSLAMAALVALGDALLPTLQQALQGDTETSRDNVIRLIRASAQNPTPDALAVLRRFAAHPDPAIQLQLLKAMHFCGYSATHESRAAVEGALQSVLQQALVLLHTRLMLEENGSEAVLPLRRALEVEQLQNRQRLLLLLGFLYEPQTIAQTERKLHWGSTSQRALAIESLDVTLSSSHRAFVIPLIDTSAPLTKRCKALRAFGDLPSLSLAATLEDMLCDEEGRWPQAWTKVCALYAVGLLGLKELACPVKTLMLESSDPTVQETASWAFVRVSPEESEVDGQGKSMVGEEKMLRIEKVAILKGTEVFAGTPEYVLASVAGIAQVIRLEAGETFIHEGALEDAMYIVVDGSARVHLGERTLAHIGQGEMVGEMQVLDPAPRFASVTAQTPMQLFRIHKDAFDEVMADRPEIAQNINRVLVRRLRAVASQT